MKRLLAAAFAVGFLAYSLMATMSMAADSITVTCYDQNMLSMGSIDVFAVRGAGSQCNMVYTDCAGRCIACYNDFDSGEQVCVDAAGNIVSR